MKEVITARKKEKSFHSSELGIYINSAVAMFAAEQLQAMDNDRKIFSPHTQTS